MLGRSKWHAHSKPSFEFYYSLVGKKTFTNVRAWLYHYTYAVVLAESLSLQASILYL